MLLWAMTMSRIWVTNSRVGGVPSRGSRVSLAALKPDQRIKAATRMPHHPSIMRPVKWPTSVAISTASVAALSLRESIEVASMAEEFSFLPSRRL